MEVDLTKLQGFLHGTFVVYGASHYLETWEAALDSLCREYPHFKCKFPNFLRTLNEISSLLQPNTYHYQMPHLRKLQNEKKLSS